MNKKDATRHTDREKNAFPFLSQSIEERLKKSGSSDLTNNFKVEEKDGYWQVKPINKNKRHK